MSSLENMDTNRGVYYLEHSGILNVDKVLIGFCALILPGFLGLFAKQIQLPQEARIWALVVVVIHIPALFCLLWHSFRWPVRLHVMHEKVTTACKEFSQDMIYILDTVAQPKSREAVEGKNKELVVRKKDGKEYVSGPMEEIEKRMMGSLLESLDSKNPLVANAIDANSVKIGQANRDGAFGVLQERWGKSKRILDVVARYARYPLFMIVMLAATQLVLKFIKHSP
jgi:hypothetical protein